MTAKRLIVNADDFGLTAGVNRGIITAHERGIVTSASLMVRGVAVEEAAAYAHSHPAFSVGLHVDLAEWAFRDEEWKCLYEVVDMNDLAAVASEVSRQLAAFQSLTGRLPTHLDSHQHVHQHEPVKSVLLAVAKEYWLPLRHFTTGLHYRGDFYGQDGKGRAFPEGIRVDTLANVFATLEPGFTELCCHPGAAEDLDSMYAQERVTEVESLCDPLLKEMIAASGVTLSSFLDWTEGAA